MGDVGHLPLRPGAFDLVTAVAPYVPTGALRLLPADVQRYEPRRALDGGTDGLDLVRRVVEAAARLLRPGGWLLVEVGGDQDAALAHPGRRRLRAGRALARRGRRPARRGRRAALTGDRLLHHRWGAGSVPPGRTKGYRRWASGQPLHIAVGAILTFAVDVTVQGLDLDAVGVILMVVGGIGLVASWCSGPAGEGSAAVAVATPSSRKTPTTGRSPELER